MAETQKVGRPNDAKMDEWEQDLHPNPTAGQNHGLETAEAEKAAPTAHDLKELHEHLEEFSNSELKQIIVLTGGTRLQQGATYVDLMDSNREPFTAMGNMEVEAGHYYVPKSEVGYRIWNRLTRQV
jgi:hypothetical protein